MNRIGRFLVSLTALAAVGLSGCSDIHQTKDDVFLNDIHHRYADTRQIPDKTLIDFGHAVCGALSHGATIDDIAAIVVQYVNNAHQAREYGYIAGTAVTVYCPKYRNRLG